MPKENQPTEIKNEQQQSPEGNRPTPQNEPKEEVKKEEKPTPQPKDEVKEEAPKQEEKQPTELETLQAEIKELKKAQKQTANVSAELETVKADLSTKEALITEYEGILNTIAEAKVEAIPEKFRALIPANLSLPQKLEWLNTAEATGLFKAQDEPQTPQVEIGKPMNAQPAKVDTSKLSGTDLMRMAYNTITKK